MTSTNLMRYILPAELLTYFTLEKVEEQGDDLHLYLEEINRLPSEFSGRRMESNGFHKESVIKDFPLRGRPVFLHVRRRRWLDLESKAVVCRDWNAVSKGTQYTQDFAAFLKEIAGLVPNSRPVDFENVLCN
jgi:transposase